MINVLFVSGGNYSEGISPIIVNQGESLRKNGVNVSYYPIKGKGFKGYLKNVPILRKQLAKNDYDVVHAHYSMSAFVASLAGSKPLFVSLMGSDVKSEKYFKLVLKIFNLFSWKKIIVKSEDMYKSLGIDDALIIPNGVDMNRFKPLDRNESLKFLGWDPTKKHVLFGADPNKKVKNYPLALEAFNSLDMENVEMHHIIDVPNIEMPYYFNAADVLLLTSHWEGSPNVIKEAMACNTPIVSSDVGDVRKLISDVEGCYITEYNAGDVAKNIKKALSFNKKTEGRKSVQHLDSSKISKIIVDEYKKYVK